MILFPSHVNCSATNTIHNIFINLRAIKVRVIRTLSEHKQIKYMLSEQIKYVLSEHKQYLRKPNMLFSPYYYG